MIHIATVHWQTDDWIPVQLDYLRRNLRAPYRAYAWLNGVSEEHNDAFDYVCTEPVDNHPVKLNILADIIAAGAERDDVLVFLDGDAFPVGDLAAFLVEKLATHKLAAVQQLENDGDIQPHPCFCATTVGFWQDIDADWKKGKSWRNRFGQWETDVGGNLLHKLREHKVDWYPLRRSNVHELHPLFFGIYDRVVYHHGAGFRTPLARIDQRGTTRKARAMSTIARRVPVHRVFVPVGKRTALRNRLLRSEHDVNVALGARVFEMLRTDPRFFEKFL